MLIVLLFQDVNEEWISDQTRFAIDGLKTQRLVCPMMKDQNGMMRQDSEHLAIANGQSEVGFLLRQASWEETLFVVAQKLRETPAEQKAAVVGGLCDVGEYLAVFIVL